MQRRKRSNSFLSQPVTELPFIRKPIAGLQYLVPIVEYGGPLGMNLSTLRVELIFSDAQLAADFRDQLYLLSLSYPDLCVLFGVKSKLMGIAEFPNNQNVVEVYLAPEFNHLSQQERCDMIQCKLNQIYDLTTSGTIHWMPSQKTVIDRCEVYCRPRP